MKQIIINSEEMQTRVAVVVDGVLHDFFMERNAKDTMVGSIYKGRIKNMEPSLQAAFVDIGVGKNAFLHYWDMIPASAEMVEEDGEEVDDEEDEEEEEQTVHEQVSFERPPVQMQASGGQGGQKGQHNGNNGNRGNQGGNHRNRHWKNRQEQKPAPKEEKLGFFARLKNFFTGGSSTSKASPKQKSQKPQNQQQPQNKNQNPQGQQNQANQQKQKQKQQQQNRRHFTRPHQVDPQALEKIPELFHEGQEILVQVTKGPIGTKGARVTTNLSIPGRYLVLMPSTTHNGISRRVEEKAERHRLQKMMRELHLPQNMGVICRTVGKGCKLDHFQRDLDLLLESWEQVQKISSSHSAPVRVYQEPPLAERALRDCLTGDVDEIIADSSQVFARASELINRYNMQESVKIRLYDQPTPIFQKMGLTPQLEGIFNRKVMLPSGGYICIDETEALIAIDVNSGKNRTGKDQPETILATNLEAVKEIARQLRLRNVGGLVVLDLIDMQSKEDQQLVFRTLKELLEEDHARTKVCPISALGLLEMTRQRENESLESTIFDNCPYCRGRGLVKSSTSMSVEIQRRLNEIVAKRNYRRIRVKAHPQVIARLRQEDRKLFRAIEEQYRTELQFEEEPMLHVEDYQLFDALSGQRI